MLSEACLPAFHDYRFRSAIAAVADASAAGFTVKTSPTIGAAPAQAYDRFLLNIGDWWRPQHTFSGDPHNLSIEEKPMGCFCENSRMEACATWK